MFDLLYSIRILQPHLDNINNSLVGSKTHEEVYDRIENYLRENNLIFEYVISSYFKFLFNDEINTGLDQYSAISLFDTFGKEMGYKNIFVGIIHGDEIIKEAIKLLLYHNTVIVIELGPKGSIIGRYVYEQENSTYNYKDKIPRDLINSLSIKNTTNTDPDTIKPENGENSSDKKQENIPQPPEPIDTSIPV
jgi:hypothetical protein